MAAEVEADGAVREGVDKLVAEIDRAVSLIEQLRKDSAALAEKGRLLESRLEQQGQELGTVREERDRLKRIYDENATLIENRAEIQNKIEAMLSRLDAVHA